MPYVVLSPLASYVFQVGRATMERKVLLANGLHDIACLPERPISREARLDLGEDAQTPYAPWSLRYSGHQFGVWAGQLGDGRAISICTCSYF